MAAQKTSAEAVDRGYPSSVKFRQCDTGSRCKRIVTYPYRGEPAANSLAQLGGRFLREGDRKNLLAGEWFVISILLKHVADETLD